MRLPSSTSAPLAASLLVLLASVASQETENDDSEIFSGFVSQEKISFSCKGRPAGFYADLPSDCKIYHMCDEAGRRFSHACPARTRFQQRTKVCDHWYMVECDPHEDTQSAASSSVASRSPNVGASSPAAVSGGRSEARSPKRHSQRVNASFPYARRTETAQRSSSRSTQIPTERFKISVIPENTSDKARETTTSSTTTPSLARSPSVVQTPALAQTLPQPSRNLQTPSPLPLHSPSSPVLPTQRVTTPPTQTPAPTQALEKQTENVFLETEEPRQFTFTPGQFQGGFSVSSFNNPTGIISQVKYVSPQREAKVGRGLQPPAPSTVLSTPSPPLRQFSGNPFLESYFKNSFVISSTTTARTVPSTNFTAVPPGEEEIGENRIEIVIPDPRKMFYIPDSNYDPGDVSKGHSTVLVIDLPLKNMKFQKVNKLEARNHDCPQCHPSFLLPGLCSPCVVIK